MRLLAAVGLILALGCAGQGGGPVPASGTDPGAVLAVENDETMLATVYELCDPSGSVYRLGQVESEDAAVFRLRLCPTGSARFLIHFLAAGQRTTQAVLFGRDDTVAFRIPFAMDPLPYLRSADRGRQ